MIDVNAVALELIAKDDSTIEEVINKATDDYFRLLTSIAEDIYDSCIAVYYAKYKPLLYGRHGNPKGFNLYRANNMSYENGVADFDVASSNLLKYGNTGEDKKKAVLDTVLSGFRGTTVRTKSSKYQTKHGKKARSLTNEWPMSWKEYCTYPNEFSAYREHWSSTKNTISDIFDEFTEKGLSDTIVYFWEFVAKYI